MRERLRGKRIVLRKLTPDDAPQIRVLLSDREVSQWMNEIKHPTTLKDAQGYILKMSERCTKKEEYSFGIEHEGKIIGCAGLARINWAHRKAVPVYWLGKEYWGRGLMTEAMALLIPFAFKELKLHRLYGKIYTENSGSIHVLEKCGFSREGVLRESRYHRGKYRDVVVYSLLDSEFSARQKGSR